MSAVYYNEHDKSAAEWLRSLIAAELIPAGEVDERSIEDVRPSELRGFTQCHFFAGIAGWAHALDLAMWPRNLAVWTGSCPCQSFSAAGKGLGFADQRHLWPAWFHLIRECRPAVVFGEQVSAAIRHGWLDLVSSDLESQDYAIGSAVFGAHSVGAFHIRQRLYFVAESHDTKRRADAPRRHVRATGGMAQPNQERHDRTERRTPGLADGCLAGVALGDTSGPRLAQQFGERGVPREASGGHESEAAERAGASVGAMGDADSRGPAPRHSSTTTAGHGHSVDAAGFWSGAEWIECRDGKARPVERSIPPLLAGLPRGVVPSSYQGMAIDANRSAEARVMRLKGYGNAICPQQAAASISAHMNA